MFKHYLTITWRTLTRNKLSSVINITGLAIGLSTSILIFLWMNATLSYNKFHEHYKDIYQMMKTQRNTEVSTGSSVAGPLAQTLRDQFPEIKYTARGAYEEALLKYGDKALYQRALYTDADYFHIMTFPALQGDPAAALRDPGAVILTESAAKRIFGNEDPIGKTIAHNADEVVKVAAVIRDVPKLSSYRFDIVLPFLAYEKKNDWLKKWDDNRILTWLLLDPKTSVPALNAKMTRLLQKKADDPHAELFAYPLHDVWLYNAFKNGYPNGGRIDALKIMGFIGGFVLLIACINFMNLATARSERRAREVGVRKTLGARRWQIVFQFLGEAFLLTFLAMLLGLLLSKLLLPSFSRYLLRGYIPFEFDNTAIWLGLLGLGLFTALVAGSYPAFFLSRFQPTAVLKGVFAHSSSSALLRKALVTFQFVLTIFLVIATITLIRQSAYIQQRPIGYDKENLVDIPARGNMSSNFEVLRTRLSNISGVTSLSGGQDNLVRFNGGTDGIQWPGKTAKQDFYIKVSSVYYDYIKTTGLKMAAGREFDPSYGTDSNACLVNEAAVRKMGLKEPVLGTKLSGSTIIGVIKDFAFNDAFNKPEPLLLYLNRTSLSHLFVRIANNDHWQQTVDQIEATIKTINPDYPFEFNFISEQYQQQFNEVQTTVLTLDWIGGFAIFISCLGLFGLSAFMVEQRTKEIGIRKILGAGVATIFISLSRDFLKPVFLAFLIAAPLAGWTMYAVLQHFDYHIALSWQIFALTGALAFFIALATISYQGLKAARSNPTNALRAE